MTSNPQPPTSQSNAFIIMSNLTLLTTDSSIDATVLLCSPLHHKSYIIDPTPLKTTHTCKGMPVLHSVLGCSHCPSTTYEGAENVFVQIRYRSGMQSTVGWRLQPCCYTITRSQPHPQLSKINSHLKWCISVRKHPYAHPQHI